HRGVPPALGLDLSEYPGGQRVPAGPGQAAVHRPLGSPPLTAGGPPMDREVLAQDRCRVIRLPSPSPKSGGDGWVFDIGQDEMAKLFKDPKLNFYADRARAIRARPPQDIPIATGPSAGLCRFAVPKELLLDPKTKEIVGYLMWKVPNA